jgi:hypothetical protein
MNGLGFMFRSPSGHGFQFVDHPTDDQIQAVNLAELGMADGNRRLGIDLL